MMKKLLRIFRPKRADLLNVYVVSKVYDLLISKTAKSSDWSICQICLNVVENSTQHVPDQYWCCPDCASEAIELQYISVDEYLHKNSTAQLHAQLKLWQQQENIVQSFKLLRERRLKKLIELSKVLAKSYS